MNALDTALDAPVIIGPGRVGRSLTAAFKASNAKPELRDRNDGITGLDGRVVLLCVPDVLITDLANQIGDSGEAPLLLGHVSGATSLEALAASGADGYFSMHPLQTVPNQTTSFQGCPAAVAGNDPIALETASRLASMAGMKPFVIAEEDRPAYHASASIASNFLVTLEQTAADLLGGIGVDNPREVLEPLIRRSLENWLASGPEALTGPIARGDEGTVEAHVEALRNARPDLLDFYETLADRTRAIAAERGSA